MRSSADQRKREVKQTEKLNKKLNAKCPGKKLPNRSPNKPMSASPKHLQIGGSVRAMFNKQKQPSEDSSSQNESLQQQDASL